ncbi:helix-turn-helix domain-containing protein [Pseudoflavitalea rhizosphaerae]|uniref:helix-turn-helix domain-containing protein n=1 Tax=Pseudoflavitalea rhizosphaerae TaxID=1884793 RepID=UPI001F49E846|nr:helix-turn-helix domain-containing protein [Pseudoflavitalea rhizosphaerae]
MVCVRCKMIVKTVLDSLNIQFNEVELGKVVLSSDLNPEQRRELNAALRYYELELLDSPKQILVESIKVSIIEMVDTAKGEKSIKFSGLLSRKLNRDYTYLANIFSEIEKSTIEKFYILKKVERVKELMIYEGMSIKEIAFQLSYSSVAHLSTQFKAVTGITPARFKKLWQAQRRVS